MHKQEKSNAKRSWAGPRNLKMLPMQMPFEITTVTGKKHRGTLLFY